MSGCPSIKPQQGLPRVKTVEDVQRTNDLLEARINVLEARTRNPDCTCTTDPGLSTRIAELEATGAVAVGVSSTGYDGASNTPFFVNVDVTGKTQSGLQLVLHVQGPNTSSLPTDGSLDGWTNSTGWVTSLNNATATYTRLTHPIGTSVIRVNFPKTFSGDYSADLSGCSTLAVPTITPSPPSVTVTVP